MKKTSNFSHYWMLILMEGILGIDQGKKDVKFLRNDKSEKVHSGQRLYIVLCCKVLVLCEATDRPWITFGSRSKVAKNECTRPPPGV